MDVVAELISGDAPLSGWVDVDAGVRRCYSGIRLDADDINVLI